MTDAPRKRLADMTKEERHVAMRKLSQELAREPRTKKMACSQCGCDMQRLFPERTVRVWCMMCSMDALGDES